MSIRHDDDSTDEREAAERKVEFLRKVKRKLAASFCPVAEDGMRVFLLAVILKPAVALLSRNRALSTAQWCGWLTMHISKSGADALATMRQCFGLEEAEARRRAAESVAQPFRTFVVFERVLGGREKASSWPMKEINCQDVDRLRQSDQPFIIVTGHFQREASWTVYLEGTSPGEMATIAAPLTSRSLRPHHLRERLQFGQLLRTLRHVRPGLKVITTGGAVEKALAHLAQPRSRLIITADPFWEAGGRSALMRPFAGMRSRTFSTGAATLSRIAQCPMVACVSYVDESGTIVQEWSNAIAPPNPDDQAADIRTTNTILDFLEDAIGRRPTQYVLYIGEERRWNAVLGEWEG